MNRHHVVLAVAFVLWASCLLYNLPGAFFSTLVFLGIR